VCSQRWNATTAYIGGNRVSQTCGGTTQNYQASFFTQNQDPCTNSGAAGSGFPWTPKGACLGGPSPTATRTPTFAPPAGLAGSMGVVDCNGDITTPVGLTWNAVSGASSYTLKRAASADGPFDTWAVNIVGTSFHYGVKPVGVAYFVVTANDANGGSSPDSAAVSTTWAIPGCPAPSATPTARPRPTPTTNCGTQPTIPPPPPVVPGISIAFGGPSYGYVRLVWNDSTGARRYDVLRATTSGGPYTVIGSTPQFTTLYEDHAGVAGTKYYYAVRAGSPYILGTEPPCESVVTSSAASSSEVSIVY
jgi:hypothetical protein